jgi:hypothetical protein
MDCSPGTSDLNFKVKDHGMGGGWIHLPPFSPTSTMYLSKIKIKNKQRERERRRQEPG